MKVNVMQWDVFCQVIDNYGDAGVCWRLAKNLAQRGQRVRLWIDDPSPLHWMAAEALDQGGESAIEVLPWELAQQHAALTQKFAQSFAQTRPDALIEAFGCEIPAPYLQWLADHSGQHEAGVPPAVWTWPQWLNLEYLSAESYVERMHLLQSPVMFGPAQGQTKTFFYPGFTAKTGGLLREPDLLRQQVQLDRRDWRRRYFPLPPQWHSQEAQWLSLFAYEPECLSAWLQQWASGTRPIVVLALAGRSQTWLQTCWQALGWEWCAPADQAAGAESVPVIGSMSTHRQQQGMLTVFSLPHVSQPSFDEVLWACDCNIVRGEDSLVRAVWAGQAFLWHIYPQEDQAHHAKLDAFLDWLQAPPAWRRSMYQLNGLEWVDPVAPIEHDKVPTAAAQPWPSAQTVGEWQACAQQAKQQLLERDDLASALLHHVQARMAAR